MSIATLTRLGIADYVITRLIDPVTFSEDDLCQDSRLNYFLGWYTGFTAASIAESVFVIWNPHTSLFAWLGKSAWKRS